MKYNSVTFYPYNVVGIFSLSFIIHIHACFLHKAKVLITAIQYILSQSHGNSKQDGERHRSFPNSRSRTSEEPHIGRYRLLKTIGKGNFAKVKLAKHLPTGKEVSLLFLVFIF